MSQERTDRVSAIAQAVILKEPGERSSYLRQACCDDPSLISEVESILAVYDRTGSLPGEEAFDDSEDDIDAFPPREDHQPDDVIGGKIGKYEIVERIGRGSMGLVYKARDPVMDRFVGIKTLPPGSSSVPQVRKRFYREARSAGKLSHKNIITVHDLGEQDGRPYIAMEFLVGEDLKSKLERGDRPTLEEQLRWMIETCDGLEHAHQKQVIHRDIKPGNIFITQEGQVKILDFGLARLTSSIGTKSGLVVGTPSYMAPEQVRGERADRRSDIYSCAATFYELLTQQKPYTSESLHGLFYKILEMEPDPVDKLNPLLPRELAEAVARAMAKDPGDRFESAERFRQSLIEVEALLRERRMEMRAEVRRTLPQLEATVERYRDLCRTLGVVDRADAQDAETLLAELGVAGLDDDATIQLDTALDFLTLAATLERAKRDTVALTALIQGLHDANELLQKAKEAEEKGALDECLRFAREALDRAPQHPAAEELASRVGAELSRRAAEEAERRQKISLLLEEAERLFHGGDFESCRSRVDAILVLEPKHARALDLGREALARLEQEQKRREATRRGEELVREAESRLMEEDDPEACLSVLEQAVTLAPDHPAAAGLKARASKRLEERKRLEQIERDRKLQKARELLREAERRHTVGEEEESVLLQLEEILSLDPANPRALELKSNLERAKAEKERQARDTLAKARKAKKTGALEEAITLCGSVLLDFPGHKEARNLLMEAESELQALRERQRREARARDLITCAEELAGRGDLEATIALLQGAPPVLAGHSKVKEALARYQDMRRAREEEAKKAKRFEDRLRRATALLGEEDYERAEREAGEALRIRPEDPGAARLLDEARSRALERLERRQRQAKIDRIMDKARSLRGRGRHKAALRQIRAVLALEPSNQEGLGFQAGLLKRIEQEQLQKQIDRKLKAARTAVKRRRETEALEHLREVLSVDASHPQALDLRARLLRSRPEGPRPSREDVKALLARAREAERIGQPKKALALGRSVLLSDPDNKEAGELVSRLRALTGLNKALLEVEMTDTSPTEDTAVNVGTLESRSPWWQAGWRLPLAAGVISLAIVVVILVRGMGSPAAQPTAFVWVDISPWARITSVRDKATGRTVEIPTYFTPCLLTLPAGSYEMEFENHIAPGEGLVSELELRAGETVRVEGILPRFDEAQARLSLQDPGASQTGSIPPQEELERDLNETASLVRQGRTREAEIRLFDIESRLQGNEHADRVRTLVDDLCVSRDERIANAYEQLDEGLTSLSNGQYQDARERFERAIEVDVAREDLAEKWAALRQGHVQALLRETLSEARFTLRQGNREDIRPSLDLARLIHPENEEVARIIEERQLLEDAWRLYQQGDYERAKSRFEEVLARDPGNLHAQQQIRRIEETELDPRPERSFEDLIRLARQSIERQEIAVAHAALRDAEALIPDDPALVLSQQELRQAARAKVRDAIRLIFTRQHDEAIHDLEDSLAALDDDPALHLHLGWAYYVKYLKAQERDTALVQKAEDQLRHALRLEPELKVDPLTGSPHLIELLDVVRRAGIEPPR